VEGERREGYGNERMNIIGEEMDGIKEVKIGRKKGTEQGMETGGEAEVNDKEILEEEHRGVADV
jgi:hypothetical protein